MLINVLVHTVNSGKASISGMWNVEEAYLFSLGVWKVQEDLQREVTPGLKVSCSQPVS